MKKVRSAKLLPKAGLVLASRMQREGSCGAVIAAAGNSTRFGAPKPFVQINGRYLFEYSVDAFLASPYIGHIVLCARESEAQALQELCKERYPDCVSVCVGGATRMESARKGYEALPDSVRFVAFHDAARPLITLFDVNRVLEQAFHTGAATAASPIFDTVKRADASHRILETVDRENLYSVSTPQVFLRDLYDVSYSKARADGFCPTDDNALAEHAGFRVSLVEIGENRKLTVPSDLDLIARMLLTRQGGRK